MYCMQQCNKNIILSLLFNIRRLKKRGNALAHKSLHFDAIVTGTIRLLLRFFLQRVLYNVTLLSCSGLRIRVELTRVQIPREKPRSIREATKKVLRGGR